MAYEIKWPIKFLARVVSLGIKLNNCTIVEQSDKCQGPTECRANFDLLRKQKGPWKSTKGGGCCNECCLAHGVFDN